MEMNGRERQKQKKLPIDRLSKLPDSILCHILSFLPTKASVATSILSRRWRFLWTHVPNLDFDCDNQHIIHRVLVLHKLPTLKSFTINLEGYDDYNEFEVETWIIAAIDRNVQFLNLFVSYRKPLPCRLFACETLVDLRLLDCGVIPTLDDVCLPRLKKLYLQNVDFEDDESLPCLLSGSPVLDYFKIVANDVIRLKSCYVSSPTVKWLCVDNLLGYLGRRDRGQRLEINAPAVEYLCVQDNLSGPIECVNLKSLIAADICHEYDERDEGEETLCWAFMLKFVDSLSNVKCLKLDLQSCDAMIHDCLLSLWNPSFNNLTELNLVADARFLSKFLENANNLEILEFHKCEKPRGWNPKQWQHELKTKDWIEPKQVPKCLLSCLNTVKVVNTVCTEDGLEIVRYLLRNAKVLKMMDIAYLGSIDSKKKKNLLQKISLFERGSMACELAFTEASSTRNWEWFD